MAGRQKTTKRRSACRRRARGAKRLGARIGNSLTADQCRSVLRAPRHERRCRRHLRSLDLAPVTTIYAPAKRVRPHADPANSTLPPGSYSTAQNAKSNSHKQLDNRTLIFHNRIELIPAAVRCPARPQQSRPTGPPQTDRQRNRYRTQSFFFKEVLKRTWAKLLASTSAPQTLSSR
jgi:hypothetical protein